MKTESMKTILDLTEGVIVYQVNCVGKDLDKGLVGALGSKYPSILDMYRGKYIRNTSSELFKTHTICDVDDKLTLAASYSQYFSGNGKEDNRVYTDIDALVNNIKEISEKYTDKTVYVPKEIGCCHANACWKKVSSAIESLNKDNIVIVESTEIKRY